METTKVKKSDLIEIREPSKELVEHYARVYQRNQSKFIRRSSLEPSHIGSEFDFEGKKLTLLGSIDPLLMIVKDSEGSYYKSHCNIISLAITGKK